MSFYSTHIAPHVLDAVCSFRSLTAQRRRVVPAAYGTVVEIGIGTGLNLGHYDPSRVDRLIGVNPPDGLQSLAEKRAREAGFPVKIMAESAEAMSLPSGIADTVVVTYTMCSIPDIEAAVAEMHRVLKPTGRLLFCEHGRSDREFVAQWQDRLTPVWRPIAGGCHLNRNPAELLAAGGFEIDYHEAFAIDGVPSLIGFHHVGSASPAQPRAGRQRHG
ncbi:MAG: class I SAM-dependent methyltransferase [Hyphomicrobiales bacterium]